ncbi:MAG: hypothetical protein R3268_06720 [Acidiferrobacterales bacterium]|nr:hypothetical protein [Acidiferrobacterales bacterium]
MDRRLLLVFLLVVGGLLPGVALADAPGKVTTGQGQTDVLEHVQPLAASGERRHLFNGRSKDLFAIQWQHPLNEVHNLTFAAGYGEDVYLSEKRYDPVSAMASVSWTGRWSGRWQPAVSSSVFVGDESPGDDAFRSLERRYFGFSVGGRMTFFERHSPFVSFRMLRGEYATPDLGDALAPSTDYSRVTAGWDWQVLPQWRLRAEAEYTLSDTDADLYGDDRSRFFFSTRFDFR